MGNFNYSTLTRNFHLNSNVYDEHTLNWNSIFSKLDKIQLKEAKEIKKLVAKDLVNHNLRNELNNLYVLTAYEKYETLATKIYNLAQEQENILVERYLEKTYNIVLKVTQRRKKLSLFRTIINNIKNLFAKKYNNKDFFENIRAKNGKSTY